MRSAQDLQAKAARHAAKQQKAAADKAKRDRDSSLSIAGIRLLPGMSDRVESHLTGFQSNIPALATDPTAGTVQQPLGVLGSNGLTIAPGYVYVAELGQLVPTVANVTALGGLGSRNLW